MILSPEREEQNLALPGEQKGSNMDRATLPSSMKMGG